MNELKPGDRIVTQIGNFGTILEPEYEMPLHHLVQLDNGNKFWMLRKVLDKATEPEIQTTKKSRCKK